jgi:superfamily II DNA/RNA helicase
MFDPSSLPGLVLEAPQRTALAGEGIAAPNDLQVTAFPDILGGAPVVMHAGTGTGKTLAYLLPVMQQLRDTPDLRAVVLAPGTELVMQTLRVAQTLAPDDIPVAVAASTTNKKRQKKRVVASTRLIVGTPDRIAELFDKKKLKGVRLLVLDELDPLLASPASAFLEQWLVRSEPKVQVVVASATLGPRSESFLERFLPDAVRIRPDARPLTQAITHRLVRVGRQAKDVALARFVQQHKCRRAIVFVSDHRVQAHLQRYLEEHGHRAVSVHRSGSKEVRKRGLDAFREGDAHLLLTTDAIARGLDVPDVDWVLHYDLPANPEAYVHRAGRTGRAGREGTSVLFAEDAARDTVRRMARALGITWQQA